MGFFDKVMFWKKKDDLALDGNLATGMDTQNPFPAQNQFQPAQQQPFQQQGFYGQGMQQVQPPQMDAFQSSSAYAASRQLEVVSAKLDALKAAMDSMSQRLSNIERAFQDDFYRKRGGW
ncbi:hypothetical protein HY640_03830 [Candidatus Woesearchaeota archaeon]|nr:hypothetical protein [Candidatus Woesearchaeota archaeon]